MTALSIICVVLLFGTIGTALDEACLLVDCTDQDPNDTSLRLTNLLTKVVESQNAKSHGEGITFTSIDKINSQAICGIKYSYDFRGEGITFTSIDKINSQAICGIKYSYDFRGEGKNTKKPYTCHSVIVKQPWVTPEPQVLTYKCTLE